MRKSKFNKIFYGLSMDTVTRVALLIAGFLAIAAVVIFFSMRGGGRGTIFSRPIESKVVVQAGDTLSKVLSEHDISPTEIHYIDQILKKDCGVHALHADSDSLTLSRKTENSGVDRITLSSGPWRRIELSCDDSGQWSAEIIEIEKETHAVRKRGEIRDGDSFYVAGQRAGIPAGILADVYDLLAFEMDFERDVRAGQQFSVLYAENFAEGARVAGGPVLAVEFDALRGKVKMYRFKKSDGSVGYYDENGNGAIKSLKRTPINNARVNSSFNLKRKHPVLGFTRAHRGVDFRAGTGTPIPAAGAGRVVKKATDAGYGNFVRIRHNGSYETLYAHMSRFQKGVNVGSTVKQGQIIGYVGSTGLSTGPHLHYEIVKDGQHVNPMTVKLPAINNLPEQDKDNFITLREKVDKVVEVMDKNPDLFIQM